MFRRDRAVTWLWQRVQHVPGRLLDLGLALMVAVAVIIAIGVAPQPGRPPDVLAYVLGLTIAALVLVRRRWPVVVLVASAATLQVYYLLDYAGIRPAVPLAVALATAWFAGAPLLFRTLVEEEPLRPVLNDSVPDTVLLGAVLLLGEAVQAPRTGPGAGEIRAAAPQRPPGLDRDPPQTDRGGDRRRVP